MRQMLGFMLQALVDAEATSVIGAEPHERTEERTTHRNGTRAKTVSTTAGDLTVKIPKLRTGSFFPTLLEPRRRVDVALHAVVMEAYVHGVSTRKVDDLVAALGVDTGISKSEVSRICAGLDEQVAAYDTRALDAMAFPYVFLDATYCKARLNSRVVSQAAVIATGVSADGRRRSRLRPRPHSAKHATSAVSATTAPCATYQPAGCASCGAAGPITSPTTPGNTPAPRHRPRRPDRSRSLPPAMPAARLHVLPTPKPKSALEVDSGGGPLLSTSC